MAARRWTTAKLECVAEHLYEECRVERYGIGVKLRGVGEYLPMWHEIDKETQWEWVRKAQRLEHALRLFREPVPA